MCRIHGDFLSEAITALEAREPCGRAVLNPPVLQPKGDACLELVISPLGVSAPDVFLTTGVFFLAPYATCLPLTAIFGSIGPTLCFSSSGCACVLHELRKDQGGCQMESKRIRLIICGRILVRWSASGGKRSSNKYKKARSTIERASDKKRLGQHTQTAYGLQRALRPIHCPCYCLNGTTKRAHKSS